MLERLHTPTLPGIPESCWLAKAPKPQFAEFSGSIECDVVIVGAGIVGLTAALALIEQGKSVTVLEARQIGAQVTGRSTAKITSQHALIYRRLIDRFGLDTARLYAEANRTGCDQIKLWIERFAIDCDYETKNAYAYASKAGRTLDIEAEVEAAREVGFAASFVEKAPLPFDTSAAIAFPGQAQFNLRAISSTLPWPPKKRARGFSHRAAPATSPKAARAGASKPRRVRSMQTQSSLPRIFR
jgi:glycine/D-amino acid oxidase-like deaminating enzyme